MSEMRHWELHVSLPPRDPNPGYRECEWRENVTCHIIAETLQEAIAAMGEKYPTATLWSGKHLGKVDIIYASKP